MYKQINFIFDNVDDTTELPTVQSKFFLFIDNNSTVSLMQYCTHYVCTNNNNYYTITLEIKDK